MFKELSRGLSNIPCNKFPITNSRFPQVALHFPGHGAEVSIEALLWVAKPACFKTDAPLQAATVHKSAIKAQFRRN
jgi:hypothetical protein